jgi:hypothetical protein
MIFHPFGTISTGGNLDWKMEPPLVLQDWEDIPSRVILWIPDLRADQAAVALSPGGTTERSPPRKRWVHAAIAEAPAGATHPFRTHVICNFPDIDHKRRLILMC